jgi:hypothetical protein
MCVSREIATHLRAVHFGGSWTTVSLKEILSDVTWQEAVAKTGEFNTIATLTCHTSYYLTTLLGVLKGGLVQGKDADSFIVPPIKSQQDWELIQHSIWEGAEEAAKLLEDLQQEKWTENFTDPKYGSYYRNVTGFIEHMYYHMGQISLIKRLLKK